MAYFLSNLKKYGHLDKVYLTVCIIGSRVTSFDSYDQHGQIWQDFIPNLTVLGFDADQEACDRINAELETGNINWNEIHIPVIFWHQVEERNIYITRNLSFTSLYRPSESYKSRFTSHIKDLEIIQTLRVETMTLDLFCDMESIEKMDIIQIDAQGAELAIFQGATEILKSTLAIVTKMPFMEVYENQPLFTDIDAYLRDQGFTLFDFVNLRRDQRKNIPLVSRDYPGPLYCSDATYFRDLISQKLNLVRQEPERIFKLACIADAANFTDYALEVLVYLTRSFGKINPEYNFASVILESLSQIPELLARPSVQKEGLHTLPIVSELQQYL